MGFFNGCSCFIIINIALLDFFLSYPLEYGLISLGFVMDFCGVLI